MRGTAELRNAGAGPAWPVSDRSARCLQFLGHEGVPESDSDMVTL